MTTSKTYLQSRTIPPDSVIYLDVRSYDRPAVVVRVPFYTYSEIASGVALLTNEEIEAIVAWWMLNKDHLGTAPQRDFWNEVHRKNLKLPLELSPSAVLRAAASCSQNKRLGKDCCSLKDSSYLASEALTETEAHRNHQDHHK